MLGVKKNIYKKRTRIYHNSFASSSSHVRTQRQNKKKGTMRAAYQCQLLFLLLYHKRRAKVKKKTVERQLDLTHTKKMTWILNFLDVHISIVDLTNSAGKKNIYTLVSFLELLLLFFLPLLLLQFGAWVLSLFLLFCGYVSSSCYSQ